MIVCIVMSNLDYADKDFQSLFAWILSLHIHDNQQILQNDEILIKCLQIHNMLQIPQINQFFILAYRIILLSKLIKQPKSINCCYTLMVHRSIQGL